MGGGAAMRAAAKAAGVFNSGVRNRRGDKNPVHVATRVSRSVAAVVSSSDGGLKQAIAYNDDNNTTDDSVTVQKPCVEIDDWVIDSSEDELLMGHVRDPLPRAVFGGAPSMQEAKMATSDLNHALEMAYLSPNSTAGSEGSFIAIQDHQSFLSGPKIVDTKAYLEREPALAQSAPKNAMKAFRLLHESPATQTVVASIACDPNVWNAVLQNEELVAFLQTHKTSVAFPDHSSANDSCVCSQCQSSKYFEERSKSEQRSSGKGFMDYVDDIKQKITVTVVDMVNGLSDTFQSLFDSTCKGEYSLTLNPDGSAGISIEKATLGASLMGLAMMVILIVVTKRS